MSRAAAASASSSTLHQPEGQDAVQVALQRVQKLPRVGLKHADDGAVRVEEKRPVSGDAEGLQPVRISRRRVVEGAVHARAQLPQPHTLVCRCIE